MTKKIYTILILMALIASIVSCRKTEAEILTPSNQMDYKLPSEQFLSIWNSMNTSYAMWDLEEKEWSSVKDEFLPEFLALDDSVKADHPISTKHLEELYTDILGDLTDHHSYFSVKNIWASDEDRYSFSISPGDMEIPKRDYYHDMHINSRYVNLCLEYEKYADKYNIHSWEDLTMVAWLKKLEAEGRASDIKYGSASYTMTIVSGLIEGNIPYIHISDFSLTALMSYVEQGY